MDVAQNLKQLLRNVLAEGDYGMTLRTGKPSVVHTTKGPKSLEAPYPTHEEIVFLLRQLMGSRGMREFRVKGVTRFMVPLDNGVRVVGAARQENEDIHIEIRKMVGTI